MGRRCQVCKKVDNLNPDLTFHKFPSDVERSSIWRSLLGFDQFEDLPKRPFICSDHFDPKDFSTRIDGKRYIKTDADPLPAHEMFEVVSTSSSNTDIDETAANVNRTFEFHDAEMQLCECVTGSSPGHSHKKIKTEDISQPAPESILTSSFILVPKSTASGSDRLFFVPSGDAVQEMTEEKPFAKFRRKSETDYEDDSLIDTEPQNCEFTDSSSINSAKIVETKCLPQPITKMASSVKLKPKLTASEIEEICKVQTKDLASSSSVVLTISEVENILKMQSKNRARRHRTHLAANTEKLPLDMKIKRKRGYVGDMDLSDFATPELTSKNLDIIKTKIKSQNKKIRNLQQTVRRMAKRLKSMKTVVKYLKNQPLLPEAKKTVTALLDNGFDQDEAFLDKMEYEDGELPPLENRNIYSTNNFEESIAVKEELDIEETFLDHENVVKKEGFTYETDFIKEEVSSIESDEEDRVDRLSEKDVEFSRSDKQDIEIQNGNTNGMYAKCENGINGDTSEYIQLKKYKCSLCKYTADPQGLKLHYSAVHY